MLPAGFFFCFFLEGMMIRVRRSGINHEAGLGKKKIEFQGQGSVIVENSWPTFMKSIKWNVSC